MADDNNEGNDELPRCSTLFVSIDGSQLQFYMTPCAMKTRVGPLIRYGGGQLSSKVSADSIKLAAPGTVGNLSGYISTNFIFESIKENKLQDMTKYRINSKIGNKIQVSRKQNGRTAYTPEEDLALMDFVNEYFTCYPIGGNALYKKAENEKVTTHTWQSMRDHFLKVLHRNTRRGKQYSKLFFRARGGRSSSENMPDVNSTAEVSSAGEDVQFDNKLLQIAYESKQRPYVYHVWESSEDENKAEEKELSSSQDADSSVVTRRRKKLGDKQDKMNDFDGEVIFRKSPSIRQGPFYYEDEKRPMAKRSKTSMEFSPDRENGSRGKDTKEMEAKLNFYQEMQSNIEKMQSKKLTVPQIIHTLLVSSGDLKHAEDYLKEGKERWTPQEDEILLSKDKTGITRLAKKRGLQAIMDRINFMEGTS